MNLDCSLLDDSTKVIDRLECFFSLPGSLVIEHKLEDEPCKLLSAYVFLGEKLGKQVLVNGDYCVTQTKLKNQNQKNRMRAKNC